MFLLWVRYTLDDCSSTNIFWIRCVKFVHSRNGLYFHFSLSGYNWSSSHPQRWKNVICYLFLLSKWSLNGIADAFVHNCRAQSLVLLSHVKRSVLCRVLSMYSCFCKMHAQHNTGSIVMSWHSCIFFRI